MSAPATDPKRPGGITTRILDVIADDKGLYFIAEWLLRRFERKVIECALDEATSRSKLVARAEEARNADVERRRQGAD